MSGKPENDEKISKKIVKFKKMSETVVKVEVDGENFLNVEKWRGKK